MSLAQLLTDQHTRLGKLIELLQEEQSQLTRGNIDGSRLVELAESKQALLTELEHMETLRHQVQQRLGYADGAEGARQAASDAGCHGEWQTMLEQSERVARLNELTGRMLSLRMKHNQQMLDYIRHIAEKTLYKPDGRNSAQPGRINASA